MVVAATDITSQVLALKDPHLPVPNPAGKVELCLVRGLMSILHFSDTMYLPWIYKLI